MINEKFLPALRGKHFFRFTGSPEHWLTAIQNFTWGLKMELLGRWQSIQVGDVFFMHSTKNSQFNNTRSAIIGVGVVGVGLKQKDILLWKEEIEKGQNIYQLLVPFSEMYLFSDPGDLTRLDVNNPLQMQTLIDQLLRDAAPLPQAFPVMGSFSGVKHEMGMQILSKGLPEHLFEPAFSIGEYRESITPMHPVANAAETLRAVPTLQYLSVTKPIRHQTGETIMVRDNELLERANTVHQEIIGDAITILRVQGYQTMNNMHADLVAENETEIILLEAKSIPDGKFRTQARIAVGQLYQYEFFDIKEHQLRQESNKPVRKMLLLPENPCDDEYVKFLQWARITSTVPSGGSLLSL